MSALPLTSPPPPTSFLVLTYPAPRVVMMRMNREKDLNCTSASAVLEMTAVFRWFDAEPSLTVAILTGTGRAFSTGADLKEWNAKVAEAVAQGKETANLGPGNVPGVEALSNRRGKKPIIAAVNGLALGGGCESAINCDLLLASERATFGLVEIQRGLAAYSGALPRLIRTLGLQRASEFALTGRTISAQTAYDWGLVNKVVPHEQLEHEAIKWASEIGDMSPDSVICTRAMLREGWTTADVVEATNISNGRQWEELQRGDNMREGLTAFREKRKPVWQASRL
ncbi:Mevalonyl-coenzyme A hydratase sidH [Fulvia fulva]|uniref:Mevalonyl-coenzyme A hydratase sidH n=1 Tax=Passalora fulva TaxID=5499 RepID=A0A9Q8UVN2_PASFU|nr:Mevalonyl-coenzyme A hydratase sidH [Fulvia fulva]KAK4611678.1 Mevalonyl-coenzyme A hydratase sidH [Fulvia fulva]UJO24042.1 Mevalonyl-coenzyme A hydratase sidH [Fulvia fulva]WPV21046.1 Mevalonyl-coenzyme A hydratase sidH [Fulvia fulva]WPV36258.1 Mevalonyl-coenzyme A hydratase sidH [Fulvia fulva]